MSDIDELKTFRNWVTEPEPREIDRARAELFASLGGSRPRVRRRQRSRVRLVLLAAAAALAIAIIVPLALPTGSPGGAKVAAAGVAFSKQKGYLIVTISDPSASAAAMQAAFKEHGLNISVTLDPVSPSLVGTVYIDESSASTRTIKPIYSTRPCLLPGGGTRCQIGLKVPLGFSGQADAEVGRPAAPGEPYATTNDGFAPGELLHCSGVMGMTVAKAAPIIQKLGVTSIWRTQAPGENPLVGQAESSVANYYVTGADPYSSGVDFVFVAQSPVDPGSYYRTLMSGC